ncbi:MAG: nicotinate-nucleotide--dimethylbenzimidazole phosphoribosyltransferase [Oscillospiraceae bacterium]|jgi:nicotinate-nucleotide--dimethylbenzimidazole phosphoribosyltransferase
MDWKDTIARPDKSAADRCRARWNSLAKPLGSLGLLEEAVVQIAALTGNAGYRIDRRAAVVMCADNGVVAQGISQTGMEVTAAVARNIARGRGCISRFAGCAGVDVFPVDIGVAENLTGSGVLDRKIAPGTGDISTGSAMTLEQARRAVSVGIDLVRELKAQGYQILATGEMGIGNTTTSSAVASVLLGRPVSEMTGRGAGLSDQGMAHKIAVIQKALEVNRPDPQDAWDVLAKVGGFDIAGMAGLFLGGALYRVPVLIDGFISSVAALVATRLRPEAACAMLATHVSEEPAARCVLDALGLRPLLCAGMRLGEGTGAVAALPLLDMALELYFHMDTFGEIQIDCYQPLSEGWGC